jgi:hypothetical protein
MWKCVALPLVLLVVAATLYGRRLDLPPVQPEERLLASQIVEISTHAGRDSSGRAFPLLIQATTDTWLAPLPVYAGAALRMGKPVDVRWLAVAASCVTVLLTYVLGVRLFKDERLAAVSAFLLLATPAQFISGRSAQQDGVWLLPFVMLWLVGLSGVFDSVSKLRRSMLVLAVAALGCAIYSEPSASVAVAALGALTAALVASAQGVRARDVLLAGAAGLVVIFPLLVWLVLHYRAAYPDTFGRWLLHEAHLRHPSVWLEDLGNWQLLTTMSGTFWDFLRPSRLFLNADTPGFAGIFLLPVAALIGLGMCEVVKSASVAAIGRVVLPGFFVGPFVAALFRDPGATGRGLIIVPFGIVLAAVGFAAMLKSPSVLARTLAVVLLLSVPVQFGTAYRGLSRATSVEPSAQVR